MYFPYFSVLSLQTVNVIFSNSKDCNSYHCFEARKYRKKNAYEGLTENDEICPVHFIEWILFLMGSTLYSLSLFIIGLSLNDCSLPLWVLRTSWEMGRWPELWSRGPGPSPLGSPCAASYESVTVRRHPSSSHLKQSTKKRNCNLRWYKICQVLRKVDFKMKLHSLHSWIKFCFCDNIKNLI